MKLLTCEYDGRTFAGVSDGRRVWEAAKDMYGLIDRLGGRLPDGSLCAGEGIALESVRLLSPIPGHNGIKQFFNASQILRHLFLAQPRSKGHMGSHAA